ncbi:S46 family peptidase [Alistipes indistinctus]|uniref:S46 family peptidase n=1 Tax=Alistipes indistinctus TaxID=626932 RepID=UPI0015F2365C|nr:S46 family peptidase [Alistipes indistinctus]BCG53037.1 Asp/Glu-specific dipeptidyl-peptidase [Alistipes indistinctus]
MKKIVLLILALFCLKGVPALADEGMWVPALIQSRIKDMKAKGFKLTAEDIYSINRSSLKDAVLLFGSGCTGEVISDEGLFLTNHHCGYYFIGSHSSVEHDYLTNGFWAMNRSEELPNPGLTVSFLIRMEDVTDRALKGVGDEMPQAERDSMVKANAAGVIAKATAGTHYEAAVEPFYYGNQYFLFVYEKFRDVRLVAAPPSAIGKFGGDTDNWMWPRHTGDFSMFRIYADKNNNPADYSKDNVPYRPRRSFTISTAGLKEGDFTMVYGNPGRTMQYVVSDAIDYAVNRGNPAKIKMRTMRLEIMNAEQAKDPATRIAYAAKNARVSNQWKKWQGESKGLARLGTLDKKRAFEAQFTAWAADKPLYRDVLPKLRALYAELAPYAFARDYYQEAYQAIEMTQFAQNAAKGIFKPDAEKAGDGFFKNYSQTIDRLSTQAVLGEYVKNVPAEWTPAYFLEAVQKAGGIDRYVDELFEQSNFSTIEKYKALASADSATKAAALQNDPALLLAEAFNTFYNTKVDGTYKRLNTEINTLYRLYMKGLMEMQPDRTFFPDANLTLRVAYGTVEGYSPVDAVYYEPFSTIDGIMEKDNPDIYDYNIPQRLRDLYRTKEYGRWNVDGSVPVCFLATNHTTGGNSGSPVLNGRGQLVGINFDRTWESTMSDYEFDVVKCRNIIVDIRYVLFVIDRIGNAGYLLDEMRFAK